MRASGSAARARSRRAAQMSATAVMRSPPRSGLNDAYAGTWPRSAMNPYPITAPRSERLALGSVIVLVPEVSQHVLVHGPAERVLQLGELREEIVLRVQ